jgi:hypothetical protein
MLRLGPDAADSALSTAHARPMDFTGRPMPGMVFIAPTGQDGAALDRWVTQPITHTRTLPAKQPKPKRAPRRART